MQTINLAVAIIGALTILGVSGILEDIGAISQPALARTDCHTDPFSGCRHHHHHTHHHNHIHCTADSSSGDPNFGMIGPHVQSFDPKNPSNNNLFHNLEVDPWAAQGMLYHPVTC